MVRDVSPAVVQIVTSDGASGSGFIIDANGRVVTNAHVVQDFSSVQVRLVGGQSYTARVLGVDDVADLALLDIQARVSFEPVELADSDLISVGDDVIAVGFPLGDLLRGSTPTITKGIISAKRLSGAGVELLQTDAATNPGNSGGPLFGSDGKVVGINTSKLFESEDGRTVEGIGLAVSINEVKDRLDSLARGQAVVSRTPTPVPAPTPSSPGRFYVDSAELHHEDDGFIETLMALESVRNFNIFSEFEVPYEASVGDWTVGNAHVVQDFSSVQVRLVGGQSYTARVLGVDDVADLALLDIQARVSFEPVELADSDLISVGDDVIAVGFPLGDLLRGSTPTITKGIISAKRLSGAGVELLQTDAATNPGNSGGPLFGSDGKVVGINTSKLFESEDGRTVEGIGLAVSINEVKDRLDSLARGQAVVSRTPTPVPAPTPSSPGRFYVDSAELHHEDDGFIETLMALESVRNFNIFSEFEVPYEASVGDWTVGFVFRNSGGGNLSYIAVTQDGRYSHYLRSDGEDTALERGDVGSWNRNAGDTNTMYLFVIEDRGWLFVNSEYVTDLDVSTKSAEGELEVATGLFEGDEVPGYSTKLSNIGAGELSLLYGPQDGSLNRDPSFIGTHSAGVDVSFAYASIEFAVSDDVNAWSGGFLFRTKLQEDFLTFAVTSESSWDVSRATQSGEDWETLMEGYSNEIDVDDPVLNHIEIFFVGHIAIMYVNDHLLGTANIESVTTSGDVEFGYGIYIDDDPGTVRFEDFVVWGLEEF